MRRLMGFLLFGGLAVGAQAQEIEGLYMGLGGGYLSYEERDEDLGVGISDGTSGYRVIGGYQFNSNYALEVGWAASGDIEEGFRAFDPDVGELSLDLTVELEMWTVRALAYAPLSRVSIFGGAGYFDSTSTFSLRFESPFEIITDSAEDSDNGLTVAGGFQLDFDHFAIRGEYEWFDTDGDIDASVFSVSGLFRF